VSIVFIGDSLTRFQYFSLAYFLRHGSWIDHNSKPHFMQPTDFLGKGEMKVDWQPWYHASTEALSPYKNCDCYREAGAGSKNAKKNWDLVFENRYFHDPIRNNTVTYFQKFGSVSHFHMHWNPTTAASQARECLEQDHPHKKYVSFR
jgi:hypothetical protein